MILGGRRLPALDAVPCPTSRALFGSCNSSLRTEFAGLGAPSRHHTSTRIAAEKHRTNGAGLGHTPQAMCPSGTERALTGERAPARATPTAPGEPSGSTRGALAPHSGRGPARAGSLLRVEPPLVLGLAAVAPWPARAGSLLRVEPPPALHPAAASPSSVEAVGDAAAPTIDDARRAGRALTDAGAREVMVFGSVAKGEARPYSDIDLVVVLDDLDYRSRRDTAYGLGGPRRRCCRPICRRLAHRCSRMGCTEPLRGVVRRSDPGRPDACGGPPRRRQRYLLGQGASHGHV